jgi:uncharacterized protein (TIGR02145 family)
MTVQIGSQIWLQKNCKELYFSNGDEIPNLKHRGDWYRSIINKTPALYISEFYGGEILYNYFAVIDPRGILPHPYKIPTLCDANELIEFCGGKEIAGLKLKSTDNKEFEEVAYLDEKSRERKKLYGNSSGFTAVETGFKRKDGYGSIGMTANFWVIDSIKDVYCLQLIDGFEEAIIENHPKLIDCGFSIRGIKNPEL